MPRYGYSTRQSGPPPRDLITEYRPAICLGNAMGNTNLWRFLCPAAGTQNCMKTGGKSPYFSPVGGANEAAHILSLMGGRAAIQGRNPAETNAFQNRGKEVSNMAVFRIEKTRDYTVMSNHHLRDRSLSLKAKGLLSLMLFLPEEPEQGNPARLNTNRSSKEKSKKVLSGTEGLNPVLQSCLAAP